MDIKSLYEHMLKHDLQFAEYVESVSHLSDEELIKNIVKENIEQA